MSTTLADVDFYWPVRLVCGSNAYKALHAWLGREYPKARRCEWCAATDRRTAYATARGANYTCNRADWLELCDRCHTFFDDRVNARAMPGETNGRSKLTEDDVRHIRALRAEGHTIEWLGAWFGVSHVMISKIARGVAWGHVT